MTVLSTGEEAMANSVNIRCSISGSQLDPDFDWLEASFGFSMQFTDETVTMAGNKTILNYSPSPRNVKVTLYIPEFVDYLTTEYDYLFTTTEITAIQFAVEQLGLDTYDIPITETPLGTYEILSMPLFSFTGLEVGIAITMDGQIEAELSGSGISRTFLEWTEWGAQEAKLDIDDSTQITAEFEYAVEFEVRPIISVLGTEIVGFPAFSEDVGSIPFDNSVTTNVYIYSPPSTEDESVFSSMLMPIILLAIGLGIGVAVGYIAGRKRKPQPIPETVEEQYPTQEPVQEQQPIPEDWERNQNIS